MAIKRGVQLAKPIALRACGAARRTSTEVCRGATSCVVHVGRCSFAAWQLRSAKSAAQLPSCERRKPQWSYCVVWGVVPPWSSARYASTPASVRNHRPVRDRLTGPSAPCIARRCATDQPVPIRRAATDKLTSCSCMYCGGPLRPLAILRARREGVALVYGQCTRERARKRVPVSAPVLKSGRS